MAVPIAEDKEAQPRHLGCHRALHPYLERFTPTPAPHIPAGGMIIHTCKEALSSSEKAGGASVAEEAPSPRPPPPALPFLGEEEGDPTGGVSGDTAAAEEEEEDPV